MACYRFLKKWSHDHPSCRTNISHPKSRGNARHTIITRVATLSSMQLAGSDLKALMCQNLPQKVIYLVRLNDLRVFCWCVCCLVTKIIKSLLGTTDDRCTPRRTRSFFCWLYTWWPLPALEIYAQWSHAHQAIIRNWANIKLGFFAVIKVLDHASVWGLCDTY